MEQPIYKLFFTRRSARGRDLPADQAQALKEQVQEQAAKLGIRPLLLAEMRWSSEQYEYFGVEQFPGLDVEQEYCRCLEMLGWYDYVEAESYLGLPLDGTANQMNLPEMPAAGDQPVYRVYLSRLTTYGLDLEGDPLNEVWELGRQALKHVGGVPLLAGYIRWNNETWDSFGVERFPSTQAILSYSQYLSVSGWYRVAQARSHLGLAVGGLLSGKEG